MNKEKIAQQFAELVKDGNSVMGTLQKSHGELYVEELTNQQWRMSVLALLQSVFCEQHAYCKTAEKLAGSPSWDGHAAKDMFGLLKSAADAWNKGYVFDLKRLAEVDVEVDLITQSEELVDKGYHQAAAVLAGAVLEHHLRSLCTTYGVTLLKPDGKPKTMEPLNADLRTAGAYDALQQKQITYLAGVRNSAAHSDGFKASVDDVRAMIRDVQSICNRIR